MGILKSHQPYIFTELYSLANNAEKNKLTLECTLLLDDEGVRLITQDDGKITDFHEEKMSGYSFVQYVIARLGSISKHTAYVTSMGYNRNEFYFQNRINQQDKGYLPFYALDRPAPKSGFLKAC